MSAVDAAPAAVQVWGLPLVPWTRQHAADEVVRLAEAGRPSYFITANVHYAMLTADDPRLAAINERAAFILADGAPLVWAARRLGTPLPERVAGSDLIYDIARRSADRGLGLFFLGGPEGVAEAASARLEALYPGLRVVGTACPPHRPLDEDEHRALIGRIRAAGPDVLLVAYGQPKGELWIAENLEALGVPVCVQVGATLDFVAGRVRRAPPAFQRAGLEWAYRIWTEPARLLPRYARDALFLLGRVTRTSSGNV